MNTAGVWTTAVNDEPSPNFATTERAHLQWTIGIGATSEGAHRRQPTAMLAAAETAHWSPLIEMVEVTAAEAAGDAVLHLASLLYAHGLAATAATTPV